MTAKVFSKLTATQKGLVLVLVPLAFELFFVVTFLLLVINAQCDFKRIESAKQVVVEMQKLLQMALRTSFVVIDPQVKDRAKKTNEMKALVARLSQPGIGGDVSAASNPELRSIFETVQEANKGVVSFLEATIHDVETAPASLEAPALARRYEQSLRLVREYNNLSNTVVNIENRLFEEHPREVRQFQQSALLLIVGMLVFAVITSVMLVVFFSRDISQRLKEIGMKANRLSFGERPLPSDGSDEIAQLDRVICNAGATLEQTRWRESALLNNSADVLLSLDRKLRIEDVGESCGLQWSYSPADLRGLSFLQLVDSKDAVRESFDWVAETGEPRKIECGVVTKNSTAKDVLLSVRWVSNLSKYYCATHDITELRNVEKLRRSFLAMASHDLRTPMSSIALVLSLLSSQKREPLTPGVLAAVEKSLESAKQLNLLVNDFLELEKFEAGSGSLELASISALDICQLADETLSEEIEAKELQIVYPKNDCIVRADENRILKVMEVMLSNAIERTSQACRIDVVLETDARFAKIGVTDYGTEISPDEAALVFEKLSVSKDSQAKRSGLGLAIANVIVNAHGGKVGVSGGADEGTTFFFTLPLDSASSLEGDL